MLQVNLDRQAISTIYSIPFKVTKDIRLAIFQFKIVHYILPTDATLFRDKIAQHDKCNLSDQKQTMNYLFVSCPDVQIFWQSFSRWWNVQNDDFIVLNDETWFKPLMSGVVWDYYCSKLKGKQNKRKSENQIKILANPGLA